MTNQEKIKANEKLASSVRVAIDLLNQPGFSKSDFNSALDAFAKIYDRYPDYGLAYDDPVRVGREYVDQYKLLIEQDSVGQAMVVDVSNKLEGVLKTLEVHDKLLNELIKNGTN
jgi:hypothetical protein